MGQTPLMNGNRLRDYQLSVLQDLYKAWERNRSVMVQMPTGTGKTHVMAAVIRHWISQMGGIGGVLIVAHRRELLDQIRDTLKRFGIDMGRSHVVVESIQKLSRGLGHTDSTENTESFSDTNYTNFEPSLVIIDEAHHAVARTYRMLWDRWPQAKFVGLTATPCRLNSDGFLDLFQTLIQSRTIREFIKMGWLSDFEYVTAEPDNPILKRVAGLKKRGVVTTRRRRWHW